MADKTYTIEDFLKVKSAAAGSFSPDGADVAYLSNITGTMQLYMMPREGGEPVQLTDFPDSIGSATFSPKERLIAFSKDEGGSENAQLYLLNPDTKEIVSLTDKKECRFNLGFWSRDGRYLSFRSNERNGKDFDVYVMDVTTRTSSLVFDKGGWCEPRTFSPDNRYLCVSISHSLVNNDLYLCDLEAGTSEHITPHTGDARYGAPRWLPDGSAFFVSSDEGREFINLTRYSLAEKKFVFVLEPIWDVDMVGMQRDGKYLGVVVNEEGYKRLRLYDPHTLKELPTPFSSLDTTGFSFSQDGEYMLASVWSPTKTLDLWLYCFADQSLMQLTHSVQGVPSEVLVEPEIVRYSSFDGLSVPYFIFKPRHIPEGTRVPVLFSIHGGPEGQYLPGFTALTQFFVHKGYAVVAPNVRGSSGYGKTYLTLDNVEKRMDSVRDLVSLKESLVGDKDLDTSRVALMGGSYGGFMVLAGLAFHPGHWAAGVDIVGIANFVTFMENTAPYRRALREAEYGSLEKDRALLERISPIHAVDKIQAPLFVIHGANDPRVPLSEAQQIIAKLAELGRRAELVVYEDEGHGISKLKNRLDVYPKVADFLAKVFAR